MVSINGPGDLDLLPFDLETGMRAAVKVGNHSEFWHARPSDSRVIRYARDGLTDRQKQCLPAPFPQAGA